MTLSPDIDQAHLLIVDTKTMSYAGSIPLSYGHAGVSVTAR